MTFLPEKFGGAQEKRGTLLPTHRVIPLIYQDWQVTVALYPPGIAIAYNGFAGGTDSQWFFQLFTASTCHPCHLRRKPLDMLRFFLQKTTRNEQREVSIDHSSFLETCIQETLNMFPNGITIRSNNHAAAHRSVVGQLCFTYYLVVPL